MTDSELNEVRIGIEDHLLALHPIQLKGRAQSKSQFGMYYSLWVNGSWDCEGKEVKLPEGKTFEDVVEDFKSMVFYLATRHRIIVWRRPVEVKENCLSARFHTIPLEMLSSLVFNQKTAFNQYPKEYEGA